MASEDRTRTRTGQDQTRPDQTRPDKTRQDKTRQDKTRQPNDTTTRRHDTARHGMTRQENHKTKDTARQILRPFLVSTPQCIIPKTSAVNAVSCLCLASVLSFSFIFHIPRTTAVYAVVNLRQFILKSRRSAITQNQDKTRQHLGRDKASKIRQKKKRSCLVILNGLRRPPFFVSSLS
jgi:hypothetical protein